MLPVRCRQCGGEVLARKSGWLQTSVQWNAATLAGCLERRAALPGPGPNGGLFTTCTALRESIDRAALDGTLPVLDDDDP
ncbi:ferredoxin [Actinomadura craniellae]|uniref:Ferredoxin n=2 Tax=Actinomadura craniellae TaxID=2231787 RepID=A0A365H5M0_9ACTN|nr:ferredoxin [Actinomadura craniellae]